MKFVSVSEMQAIEKEASENGVSYQLMMQNAGEGVARIVDTRYGQFQESGVLGLVGSGNNGGDTLVALISLAKRGWKTNAYLSCSRDYR